MSTDEGASAESETPFTDGMVNWNIDQYNFGARMAVFHISLVGATLIMYHCLIRYRAYNNEPIFGIYYQPGIWYNLKYAMFRTLLWLRSKRKQPEVKKGETAGYGKKSKATPEAMEMVQELNPKAEKAVDAVYICSGNKDGEYFVTATARRHNNLVQTLTFLRIPEWGFFEIPCKPDTNLNGTHGKAFAAGGLHIECLDPMHKWSIKFDGQLRDRKTKKLHAAKVDLVWESLTPYYDFDTDMSQSVVAAAIAREPWSREKFKSMEAAHQTHYEQFGRSTGKVSVEGFGEKTVKMEGLRDHSYGDRRVWRELHRYALHYFYLSDRRFIAIGQISMPVTMSRLPIGYIVNANGTIDVMSECDFELYQHGEGSADDLTSPQTYAFTFYAEHKRYVVEVSVLEQAKFYMDLEWGAAVHEKLCKFKVNGVEGWGIAEWEFGRDGGRPKDVESEWKIPQKK